MSDRSLPTFGGQRAPDENETADAQTFSGNSLALTTRRERKNLGLGISFGGKRNLYETLGYDPDPSPQDYKNKYERQDVARTIVNAPASTAWRVAPDVVDDTNDDTETPFEEAYSLLLDELRALHYWERADKLSGIGHFGVLVIGLQDVDGDQITMADPVARDELMGDPLEDITYFATFSEARVSVEREDDPSNPRYGLPAMYEIAFDASDRNATEEVHHERVIHIAEGLLEDEVLGTPRLEAIYNRLEDLEKVVGGSAEMTWRGADRKFLANATTDKKLTNAEEMQEQIEEMVHGMNPVAYTRNVELQPIDGEVVDPTGLVDTLLKLIAGETGIPQRILTGSERGELASTQDRATFYGRISERQEQFCEPQILRPTLDRLVELEIIPPPSAGSYTVEWDELFELSELEQADLRAQNAETIQKASPQNDPTTLATIEEIRSNVLGWHPVRGTEVDESELDEAPVDEFPSEVDPEPEETPDIMEEFEDLQARARAEQAISQLSANRKQ